METPLTSAYATYLNGGGREDLGLALRAAGATGLAELIAACPVASRIRLDPSLSSAWAGRSCTVSEAPAADAEPWSLWFDPVELVVMTLVPRPSAQYQSWPVDVQQVMTPHVGWLSLGRTRRWQMVGWALAGGSHIDLDAGAETDPARGFTGAQAVGYAAHFDKSVASPFVWTAVHDAGEPVASALWSPSAGPELAGRIGEGEVLIQHRSAALVPDTEDPADDDPATIFDEFDRLTGVEFRTAISSQRQFRA